MKSPAKTIEFSKNVKTRPSPAINKYPENQTIFPSPATHAVGNLSRKHFENGKTKRRSYLVLTGFQKVFFWRESLIPYLMENGKLLTFQE